jgi:hypothetical protein
MINNKLITKCIGVVMFAALTIGCSKDDDSLPPPDPNSDKKTKYVVGFESTIVGKATAGTDYVLNLNDLSAISSGKISAEGIGIEQKYWTFYQQVNNTVFTFGQGDGVNSGIAYQLDKEGKLVAINEFDPGSVDNFGVVDDNKTLIAVDVNYSGYADSRFVFLDAATGKVVKEVKHPIDVKQASSEEKKGHIPWVTGIVQNNDKLFVSYYKIIPDGTYMPADETQANIAVYSYPEMKFEKIISDQRTSPIGTNGHSTGIEKTENGDIYSFSSSAVSAGFANPSKPSGIVRIKNGTTEFDKDYFFDVENAPNGGKIFWMDYIADGKALARIILKDEVDPVYYDYWKAFYTRDAVKMVVLDLINKTVTDVNGIPPRHGQRYSSPVYTEGGKVYINGYTEESSDIYIIDPKTATATKGAKVRGNYVKGIFKVTN